MYRSSGIPLALWLAAVVARADEVHLESGRVIEGTAVLEGDKLVIALESGHIAVPLDSVARVERSTAPLTQVRKREAGLAPNDTRTMLALADFCRRHGLSLKERELLERILKVEPDHTEARRRLGYVRTRDGWMTQAERARRDEIADLARRQTEVELATKRTELRIAQAELERERARAQQLERQAKARQREPSSEPRTDASSHAPYYPHYPLPATILLAPANTVPVPPQVAPPPAPAAPPSFGINGVRAPSSYFDDALRR